jgi:arylsulfatase A-like enzyme/Tfp pilus assembly protein PilF
VKPLHAVLVPAAALLAGAAAGCAPRDGRPSAGGAPAPGALLITVDTFRADFAGCMGHPGGLTPELDRIARRGLLCRDAFAPCPLTAVSHATILTGLDPPRHGVRENATYLLPETVPTLAAHLRDAGYRTGAVIAALPLSRTFGFSQGFDAYDDALPAPGGANDPFYSERTAEEIVDGSLAWIRSLVHDDRWFLWSHFFDAHYPYEPPRPFRVFPARDAYEREVRAMDHQIHRLTRGIREARGGEPWTFLVSDHGEALGGHGESSHGVLTYFETMHGLLAVAPPEGTAPASFRSGVITELARFTDVLPTALDALEIDPPPGIDGRSLLRPTGAELGAYGESYYSAINFGWSSVLSWRDERWTYIEAPAPELYDRRTDPGERFDVSSQHPDVVRRLSGKIAERTSLPDEPSGPALDPDTEAQLLALGYVTGGSGGAALQIDASKSPRELIRAVNHMFRGIALMSQGKPAEALPSLQAAYRGDPNNSTVLFHLADCLYNLGDLPTSLAYYRRCIELDPSMGQAWGHLASMEFDRGNRDEAMSLLERGLSVNPTAFPLLMTAGDLHRTLGETDEARTFYALASERYGNRAEPWVRLAELEEQRGDSREANRYWDRALEANPHHPFVPDRIRERLEE